MKVLGLFSGIGGFELGMQRAGFEVAAMCEIDPFCRKVLARHWPDVPIYGDIRELTADDLGFVPDIITGGFPCQPFSVAGQRNGTEDDRHLWPEMARVIEDCRPRWVVAENVPGIRDMALDGVLADLEGFGYACQTFDIPACAVDAPHRRARLWIVGHANDCDIWKKRGIHFGQSIADGSRKNDANGVVAHAGCGAIRQPHGTERRTDSVFGAALQADGGNVEHAKGNGRGEGRTKPELRGGRAAVAEPGDTAELHGNGGGDNGRGAREGGRTVFEPGNTGGHWDECQWIVGGDGKRRRVGARIRRVDDGLSGGLDRDLITLLAKGVPNRVGRLRALGNAVIPQIPEMIGRAILSARSDREPGHG